MSFVRACLFIFGFSLAGLALFLSATQQDAGDLMLVLDEPRRGERDIYLLQPDGDRLRLTEGGASAVYRGMSADGRWVAYRSGRNNIQREFRVRIDGQRRETTLSILQSQNTLMIDPYSQNPHNGLLYYPNNTRDGFFINAVDLSTGQHAAQNAVRYLPNRIFLSPYNTQMIYGAFLNGQDDLFWIRDTATPPQQITSTVGFELVRAWSPDGAAVMLQHVATSEYAALSLADGALQPFATFKGGVRPHGWQGDYWYFSGRNALGNEDWYLYRVRSDGQYLMRLTDANRSERFEAWSPDGAWVYYSTESDGAHWLARVQADGSAQQTLIRSDAPMQIHSWSPDGRWFYYRDYVLGSNYDLFRASPTAAEIEHLTQFEGNETFETWSPDNEWGYVESRNVFYHTATLYRMRPNGDEESQVLQYPDGNFSENPYGFLAWWQPPTRAWQPLALVIFGLALLPIGLAARRSGRWPLS